MPLPLQRLFGYCWYGHVRVPIQWHSWYSLYDVLIAALHTCCFTEIEKKDFYWVRPQVSSGKGRSHEVYHGTVIESPIVGILGIFRFHRVVERLYMMFFGRWLDCPMGCLSIQINRPTPYIRTSMNSVWRWNLSLVVLPESKVCCRLLAFRVERD
jgi:hypothetical protein